MDAVWRVLNSLTATKRNDFDLHITCLEQMCPLFFCMDYHNYDRYLTRYIILLLNLNDSHPGAEELIKVKGFSVSRSPASGARNAVDLTIEQTIKRQAKCKGRIVGFSQNAAALLEEPGLGSKDHAHKDCQQSQMRQSEKSVKTIKQSFESYINPFETFGNDKLI
ncbi:hypothetical protein PoB_007216000 [Plakobranchus ocellatus]|uniref:Uncharacterized protein n=1 Tax=Plakobranchus ocellatus TaxID=259542 RepID=A0AAV4DNE2_9GAST|nr:hypothetical protein PoB_007216000 [Plakobranchus ocellatus]